MVSLRRPGLGAGPGRPSSLKENEPQIRKLLAALRRGNFLTVAVKLSGIPRGTVSQWLEKGGQAKAGPYRRFADRVDRAIAEGEDKVVSACMDLATGKENVRAIELLLTLRWRARWRKARGEGGGSDGGGAETEMEGTIVPYRVHIPEQESLAPPGADPEGSAEEAGGVSQALESSAATRDRVEGSRER